MRTLMIVRIPTEEGNAAIASGSLGSTIAAILTEQKPEATYFAAENGMRTAYVVVNLADSSQIPVFAEPWFLAFNAKVEFHPAMNVDDLKKAMPGIESAVKNYARGSR